MTSNEFNVGSWIIDCTSRQSPGRGAVMLFVSISGHEGSRSGRASVSLLNKS